MMGETRKTESRETVVANEKLKADMEKYHQMALDMGADEAKIVPASILVQTIRTRLACIFPRCNLNGTGMWCPPRWETPFEIAQAIRDSYQYAIAFRKARSPKTATGPAAGSARESTLNAYCDVYQRYWKPEDLKYWRDYAKEHHEPRPATRAGDIALIIEAEARKDGHQFAFTGFSGSCVNKLCDKFGSRCVALTTGICRFPGVSRPDGAGAMYCDWLRTSPQLGWQFQNVGWSTLPEDIEGLEPLPGKPSIVLIE